MPSRVRVAGFEELTPEQPRTVTADGLQVAVVKIGDRIHAFEDRCPHRDAQLSPGTIEGCTIRCPLHGWQFELEQGQCVSGGSLPLPVFETSVGEDGSVYVELPEQVEQTWNRVHRYLVRYGHKGWVERVGSIERIECRRGDEVVIQTARGLEAAVVLAGPEALGSGPDDKPTGELVRAMTPDDLLQSARNQPPDENWLSTAQEQLDQLASGIQAVDAETLFDGLTTVIYFVGEPAGELEPLHEQLAEALDQRIQLHPLSDPPPTEGGCGKPGCGGGGGGCSA